jgi:hypothetical protein
MHAGLVGTLPGELRKHLLLGRNCNSQDLGMPGQKTIIKTATRSHPLTLKAECNAGDDYALKGGRVNLRKCRPGFQKTFVAGARLPAGGVAEVR